jgi:signal transduction histidine kinase
VVRRRLLRRRRGEEPPSRYEFTNTEISAAVVRDGSGKARTFGQLLDITERRRAEDALREKAAELDRHFLHALDLLCIADTDGYFHRVNGRMDRPLQELLELSRVGRARNPPESVMFSAVVEEACELQQGIIQSRGVAVVAAPDLPEVRGDRTRLIEVVQELIDNACRFMGDQKEPRVDIGRR